MSLTRHIPTFYKHVQATASATWTITHNLGRYPIVDAFTVDGNEIRIMPNQVTYVDDNVCTLTFSQPFNGHATVV